MNKFEAYQDISKLLLDSDVFREFLENDNVLTFVNEVSMEQIDIEDYEIVKESYNFNKEKVTFNKQSIEIDFRINNILLNIIQEYNLKINYNEFLSLENIMLNKKHIMFIKEDSNIVEIENRFFIKTNL